jgi:hypothetical protein
MPTVQPVNSTLASDPGDPAGMSPESLMAYCSTRLSSLDTQMQQIFNQQTQSAATINDLNNISGLLNDLPAASTGTPPTITMSKAQYEQLVAAYSNAVSDLSPTDGTASAMYGNGAATPLGKELVTDSTSFTSSATADPLSLGGSSGSTGLSGFGANASGTYTIPASVVTNITQNLKTYTSSLNSDAEMQMINLQSLMSSRQTAVELSTNILQALSTTDESIVSNLKPE